MEHRAIVNRFFDLYAGQHNVEDAGELFVEGAVIHNEGQDMPFAGYRQLGEVFLAGFPDISYEQQDQLVDGDKVVTRGVWSGTHTGDFMGIPPTGRAFRAPSITIDRIEGGKIAERWNTSDLLGMMQQLGVIPALEVA